MSSNGFKNFISPRGIIRAILIITCIVSFACIADSRGYSNFGAFQFLLAMGIIGAAYCVLMTIIYFFKATVETMLGRILPILELLLDFAFAIIFIVASSIAAAKCDENSIYTYYCKHSTQMVPAIVFGFICFVLFTICTVFDIFAIRGATGGATA